MRRIMLALAALGLALPAAAGESTACFRVEGSAAPWVKHPATVRMAFQDGAAQTVLMRQPSGFTTASTMTPLRDGVSTRLTQLPLPTGGSRAVFTLATVEASGTVLLETWIKDGTGPEAPSYIWNRYRCDG